MYSISYDWELTKGPVELIRIRLQTQKEKMYTGPIDCIRKIYKIGGIRALYRGMGPTIGREGHGMGYSKHLTCFNVGCIF
jgi:Mitochondrial carrier protein